MFEVYKEIAGIFNVDLKDVDKLDLELFEKLKEIVTKLVLVKPEDRMKLEVAKTKLDELETFTREKMIQNFLLLDTFLEFTDDPTMTNTDETTQNSLRLMNEIRSTRLFTIPTTGDDKKLTQRLTNLCVAVSAMRLLSYALVEFLEPLFEEEVDKGMKISPEKISEERDCSMENVLLPESSNPRPGFAKGMEPVKREPYFVHKLLRICCGVISPRSLNGLNHRHLDDDFHIAAQEQNIRKKILQ